MILLTDTTNAGSGTYEYIIMGAAVIILSFLFNAFSERSNIPSVLLLIVLGFLLNTNLGPGMSGDALKEPLELMGTVGLIMIVLEAALDLELTKEKYPLILRSLAIALVGLVSTSLLIALVLVNMYDSDVMSWQSAMLYATPLSILSSAIIIPSVGGLGQRKKEFHIYESTFSDILGIMQFYFLQAIWGPETQGFAAETGNYVLILLGTVLFSLIVSYGLIFLFQSIKSHVKLFLLISILLLLYAVGKINHVSSLITIFLFGLVMSNHKLFFRGKLKEWLNEKTVSGLEADFHVVTIETAFLVRTFFFVLFGMTISIAPFSTLDSALSILKVSFAILAVIYGARLIYFRIFIGKDIVPQLFIAPRGLITVLLFYQISPESVVEEFNEGILSFIIVASLLVMSGALILHGRRKGRMERIESDPMIIPPDQIYKGFSSKVVRDRYSQPKEAEPQSQSNS
ncbi:cation:proton antiporter [Pontibacter sp. G13]|uniref:cation:proton antiporter domain-containing protein n=1 Tax=Pontibacter sp. G13 TaxID=3074898 RepID=UPI002889F214|nr:cation:proton antiporter [Pontibacter sp. G13]WNJ18982.1 cation:proton antiporter [Pontibacter sp. G13]